MEAALAVFVKLLDAVITALKPYGGAIIGTINGFFLGTTRTEFKAMERELEKERQLSELERDLTAFHDSLSDGELRNITAKRIARLRYKARLANGGGGHDD